MEDTKIEKTTEEIVNETVKSEFEKMNATKDAEIANLKSMIEKLDKPETKVGFNSEAEDIRTSFKTFIGELKTGVTVAIPAQYIPEIVPTVGQWDIKGKCNYQGRLESTVMYITRSISGGDGYWQSTTGGGQSTTISATSVPVNMDCLTVKVPIFDYQVNTKGFDVLGYVNKEVNKVIPKAEAVQILTGTGSPFTGIYGDTSVNTVSQTATGSIANLTLADLRNMVASIDTAFRTNDLKWYCDISEEQTILGVCDANNRVTDVTTGISRILGFEVVPVSSGVLNGSSVSTTASKHFILANLKEAVDVADQGLKVEPIRTTHGQTDYFFYNYEAFGIRQPKAATIFKLHA